MAGASFVLVGAGALTGILSGLFGLGGGFLLVPLLSLLGWPIKEAIGTSLFYVTLIGVSGALQHLRMLNVDLRFVGTFAVAAIVAAPLGAMGSNQVPGPVLQVAFGALLAAVAINMIRARPPAEGDAAAPPPGVAATLGIGLLVGAVSGFFGVGGGLLFVPAQVAWFKLPIKRAVGNSLTGVMVTGLAGMTAHLSLGHVDWHRGLLLVAGGLLGLLLGTRVLRRTHNLTLHRLLVALLLFLAVEMAGRGVWALVGPLHA